MKVWNQLEVDKVHVAYAIIGVSTTIFAASSLFLKEKLFIGEATTSTLVGIITGPKVLNWFNPLSWGNTFYITQELSRIVLIIQIFAVSVELPKKYLKYHAISVLIVLFCGMITGWLITALFIWIIFPKIGFSGSLLISGCVTATDPVLAAAIVGKGKFGQRIPGHLKNLLSAESGANDGMAFPFVLLAANLILHNGESGKIVKDWICVSILYECILGIVLGCVIGYVGRHLIKFCETKNLIDRESFFVFYILLSLICTGFGSILGVDDLLVSFAAGTAFAWDGWFAKKTEESNLSNIVDLLLNMGYFIYLGSILPWSDFNNEVLGLNIWRLLLLSLVVIFLRRIPIFLVIKPFTPDLRTWKEAFFCGHFGPIGVGAVFCSMIATSTIEKGFVDNYPTSNYGQPHTNSFLVRVLWPIVTFIVITSILVHGSSVSMIALSSSAKQIKLVVKVTNSFGEDNSKINKSSNSSFFVDTESPVSTSAYIHKLGYAKDRSHVTRRKSEEYVKQLSRMDPVKINYDEDGILKKPEIAYIQGGETIIEDHNGDVIDQFNLYEGMNLEVGATHSFMEKLRNFFKVEDRDPDYDINIDERIKRKKLLKRIGKEVLSVYQIENEIVIENDDGDIVRRYIINDNSIRNDSGGDISGIGDNYDIEQNQQSNECVGEDRNFAVGEDDKYNDDEIRYSLKEVLKNRAIRFAD